MIKTITPARASGSGQSMLSSDLSQPTRGAFTRAALYALLTTLYLFIGNSRTEAATASSVSQNGITWTFSTSHTVGQFANGEWWVVGPVTINSISPAWDGTRHGTMLNPMASATDHGFDTRIPNTTYQASLNVADDLPITVANNTSVVSVKSFQTKHESSPGYLETIAILTVLPSAPASDAFRPPYAGNDKTIPGRISDLDYSFLQSLAPVSNTPSKSSIESNGLGFPILDILRNWQNTSLKVQASGVNLHYGRQLTYKAADVALWLNLNHTNAEKQSVLIKAVQRGIDCYGLAKNAGMIWLANGGHNGGRKMYMVLAAKALNHSDMLSWCNGANHLIFQEDRQHFYVTQNDIDTPRTNSNSAPYTQAMLGMPEWASNPLTQSERDATGSQWNKAYRTVNGGPNTGIALAANIMGVRSLWNWEPFFEYIDDRYWPMENASRANALNQIYLFPAAMWDAYRNYSGGGGDTTDPSTPTGVTASNVTAFSVDLSWNASTDNIGVLGYYVYTNGSNPVPVIGTSTTISELSPETSYAFTVSAYDAGGNESSASSAANVTTPASSANTIVAVTASADDGNVPSNTIDGNLSTRWSAQGSGQWLQFQLDDVYTIEAISIAFHNGDSRSSYFDIQTSNDASNWTTVYSSGASSGTTLGLETFDITDSSAQFIRYLGYGNSTNTWNSINEVQLTLVTESSDSTAPSVPSGLSASNTTSTSVDLDWTASTDNVGVTGYFVYIDGQNPVSAPSNSITLSNLIPQSEYTITVSAHDAAGNESAQSSSVTVTTSAWSQYYVDTVIASDDDGNVAANTLDEDFNTRWSAEGDGEWIEFELDDTYLITKVCIAFYNGASRIAYFDLQVSDDGTNWTTVLEDGESSGTEIGFEHFDITDVEASYVRYVGHGNSDNAWNSLTEVEIIVEEISTDTTAPSTPSGLASSNITQSSVDLSWSASTDNVAVTGYKVYTGGSNPVTVTGTSTTIMGLSAGTGYSFTVSAIDAAGNESSQSSAESVTTTSGTPSSYVITGNGADVALKDTGGQDWNGNTAIRVGGTSGSDDAAAMLIFELPTLASGESVTSATLSVELLQIANTPNGSADLYGLPYQSTTSINSSQYYEGAYGGDSNATGLQDNFITTASAIGTITTNGTGSANLVDYLNAQYAAGANGGDYVIIRINSDVINESSYSYYNIATANNTTAQKPVLAFDTNTAASDTEDPSTPTSLAAGTVTATSAALSWNASTDNVGVTGYRVYTNGASPVSVTGTSATISGLSQYTSYSFTVTAVDAANNESSASSAVNVTTADGEAPTVPTGLASSNVTTTTVDLSWSAASDNVGVTGYKVYTDGSNPVSVTGTSKTVTGLTANTTYDFSVTAVDAAGNESLHSDDETVTTSSVVVSYYTIDGDTNDRGLKDSGGTDWVGETGCRVGGSSGSDDKAMIFVFVLPTLAAGEVITDATLSFELYQIANSPNGADLYGLPYQTSLSIGSSQYYDGTFDGDSSADGLQEDILINSLSLGTITTDSTGSANLVDFLNDQYTAGAEGGDYVLLRLNSGVSNEGNYHYYTVRTADDTNNPVLWIETEK